MNLGRGEGMRTVVIALALLAAVAAAATAQEPGAPQPGAAAGQQAGAQQTGGLDLSGSLLGDASVLQTAFESPTGISPGGFSQLTLNMVNRNRKFAKVEGTGILTVWTGAYAPLAASQAAATGLFHPACGHLDRSADHQLRRGDAVLTH
jgi:hypothetical protein